MSLTNFYPDEKNQLHDSIKLHSILGFLPPHRAIVRVIVEDYIQFICTHRSKIPLP